MFTQALIGKLSWERKAHVDGILGSVPVWPDVVSSFQDKRMWTVSCWYFLASQARNWEGEMVCAPPWAIITKHKQRRVSRRPVPKEFEASPAVSPRKVLTSQERGWVQEHGGTYPGLQKMPDPSSSDWGYLDLWVSTWNFSKRCWFSEVFCSLPSKLGFFPLEPLK